MKERRLCYISRTYYNQTSAGNKAKTDYEKVLHSMGGSKHRLALQNRQQ